MTQHYFETPKARGERVYREGSGFGVIIEMHDGTYGMHNGVRWDSSEIANQYIGIDGIDPRTLTTELLYFLADLREQRNRAEAAEQERDKLLAIVEGIYGAAINDVSRWEGGMTVGTPVFQDRVFAKHLVRDLQPFIFPEGSKPDATE